MKSLTFNGIRKDWLYLLEGRQKAPFAPITRNLLKIPGRPGALLQSSEIEPLVIYQPIGFVVKNDIDALTKKDELASWLVTMDPVALEFDDEPGRIYYAVVQNTISDYEKFVRQRRGNIEFLVLDGFGYGPEHEVTFPSDVVTLTNEGTAEADPIFELEVQEPVTFAMIQNQDDEYMMIGKPAGVQEEIINEKRLVFSEYGHTIDTWEHSKIEVDDYYIDNTEGTLTTDGSGIVATNYGTGQKFHGPVAHKEIEPIQDFEMEVNIETTTEFYNETLRIEVYMFDEYMNMLGKVGIIDDNVNLHRRIGVARIGEYSGFGVRYPINSRNFLLDFLGRQSQFNIKVRRKGNLYEFYFANIEDGVHDSKRRLWAHYSDLENKYTGRLKYIQVFIGKHGNKPNPYQARINNIRVFEVLEVKEDQTPYIAYPGDLITFDHKNADILINGESRVDLKQFGASFFKLKRGFNQLVIMPGESFVAKCRYREKYR